MDKETKYRQDIKKSLEEMFSQAEKRCVETVIKSCGDRVSISAGYTLSGHEEIKDSYFMVTGDRMFPEYVKGIDSLAKLLCGYEDVLMEQERHTIDGFYNAPIKGGHPLALLPEEIKICRTDGMPVICTESC